VKRHDPGTQIQKAYGLEYIIVSLLFLSPFGGYATSAFLNNWIHLRIGQRGIGFASPLCHLAAYAIIASGPPYPVLVVAFLIAGFGNGLGDAAWNAWIGNMASANEVLGVLHGLYGLGAVLAPLLATSMITKAGLPWNSYYYFMV
jgi:fucose permease